jgi:hypothetical protein
MGGRADLFPVNDETITPEFMRAVRAAQANILAIIRNDIGVETFA